MNSAITYPVGVNTLSPPDANPNANTGSDTASQASVQGLDQFLASVEKRALRMAQMATSHDEDALDIVQDAMLTLAKKYAHKPAAQWPPLFHRILQNRIRDWYRHQGVRNRFRGWFNKTASDHDDEIDPIQIAADPHGLDPEQVASNRNHGEAIIAAVAQLPLRQQQTFMLRIWEGLDVAQTAEAMGVSEGSIKTHLSRALNKLREQLSDLHPADPEQPPHKPARSLL